jgi:hypothetical protein
MEILSRTYRQRLYYLPQDVSSPSIGSFIKHETVWRAQKRMRTRTEPVDAPQLGPQSVPRCPIEMGNISLRCGVSMRSGKCLAKRIADVLGGGSLAAARLPVGDHPLVETYVSDDEESATEEEGADPNKKKRKRHEELDLW